MAGADFKNDGRSDILWQHFNGTISTCWLGQTAISSSMTAGL
jgi:hypothetical protein